MTRQAPAAPAAPAVDDIEAIVAAAVERAAEIDPDEPSGADYVSDEVSGKGSGEGSGEKTFQQAIAEFEASPRRRRRTRGNSRSDRRPKPEDFPGSAATGPVAKAEETMIKVREVEEDKKVEAPADAGRPSARTRGRRRAGRSFRVEETPQAQEAQQPAQQQAKAPVAPETATVAEEKPRRNRPSELSSGAPAATRGRRRAVRRTMAAADEADRVPEQAREQKPEKERSVPEGGVEKRSSRGRRRVTRRTTGR